MRHKQKKLLEQNQDKLVNYIQDNKLDVTPDYMIYCITEADPDQQQFKNSKWLIKNLLDKSFLWEDIESGNESKAYDTLSRFLNIRKQWPESNLRDINHYKGLSGIAEAIRPYEITKGMNDIKREEKAKIYDDTIVLYDKNDYLVVIPKTEEASCFWGRNTEWCTASTKSINYFNHYNKNGPLLICITPDNHKYQFHVNSDPMNENDKKLGDIIDPVLTELALLTGKIGSLKNIDYTNYRHCEVAVKEKALYLTQISKDIKNYNELCKLAVQHHGTVIQEISPDIENYGELCKLAVQQNGYAIGCISPDIENYGELRKLAVQQNGYAIGCISPDIENYNELCKLAVQQNSYAIQYISSDIENYKELCELAVQQDGYAIPYISSDIENYKELCELAVQQNGHAIRYISPDVENYNELCKLAVQQNGYAIGCISPDIENYNELLKISQQQISNEKMKNQKIPEWLETKSYENFFPYLDDIKILQNNKYELS